MPCGTGSLEGREDTNDRKEEKQSKTQNYMKGKWLIKVFFKLRSFFSLALLTSSFFSFLKVTISWCDNEDVW